MFAELGAQQNRTEQNRTEQKRTEQAGLGFNLSSQLQFLQIELHLEAGGPSIMKI